MATDLNDVGSLEAMVRAGTATLAGLQTPRLDARVLAKYVTGYDDAGLIANAHEPVTDEINREFHDLVLRRAAGEPVAYLVGAKEFWGLTFTVTGDVLIPRSDSECAIEALLTRTDHQKAVRILDLGTGSGCLIAALASALPHATGLGVDISPAAVALAQRNIADLGFQERIEILVSDWFEQVEGQFDLIVVNAPYIPDGDRERLIVDVQQYEPPGALFAGEDGLDAYRRILPDIGDYLFQGGRMILEFGDSAQGSLLRKLVVEHLPGWAVTMVRDLAGRDRALLVEN